MTSIIYSMGLCSQGQGLYGKRSAAGHVEKVGRGVALTNSTSYTQATTPQPALINL